MNEAVREESTLLKLDRIVREDSMRDAEDYPLPELKDILNGEYEMPEDETLKCQLEIDNIDGRVLAEFKMQKERLLAHVNPAKLAKLLPKLPIDSKDYKLDSLDEDCDINFSIDKKFNITYNLRFLDRPGTDRVQVNYNPLTEDLKVRTLNDVLVRGADLNEFARNATKVMTMVGAVAGAGAMYAAYTIDPQQINAQPYAYMFLKTSLTCAIGVVGGIVGRMAGNWIITPLIDTFDEFFGSGDYRKDVKTDYDSLYDLYKHNPSLAIDSFKYIERMNEYIGEAVVAHKTKEKEKLELVNRNAHAFLEAKKKNLVALTE